MKNIMHRRDFLKTIPAGLYMFAHTGKKTTLPSEASTSSSSCRIRLVSLNSQLKFSHYYYLKLIN